MNAIARLRELRPDEVLSADEVFEAVFAAGSVLSDSDREEEAPLEIAIRLLEARRSGQISEGCEYAVEYLAEECGLYPYIEPEKFNHLTQSIIEAHSLDLQGKVYLHSKQMQALLWLLAGDNVILSAPTSFGKSMLVDAFISKKMPHTVVMIMPTIALIDETRRRLSRNFGAHYTVITTVSEPYNSQNPTIFVLTQERLLSRSDVSFVDLLFVDEFYKLDPDRDDGRFETLNLALYKTLPKSRQCFMAGPHIKSIKLGERWTGNFRFVRTDYRTVTVNVIDRSAKTEKLSAFLEDLRSVGDDNSLVFTAAPGTAHTLMDKILESDISYKSDVGTKLGAWIAQNYHSEWAIARGAEHGIAVHHGRLPRSLGQLFVQLFDKGELKLLICTSTLIEGVNTAAANVFIYDKKINRSDFDFFSFANIRGRVGRMMRHFVGNAFLYHEPPEQIETHVDVPVLSDPGASTDFLLVNVEPGDLTGEDLRRQESLPEQTGLPAEILREHGALGMDILMRVNARVREILQGNPSLLAWRGHPDKAQRITLAELALLVAHARRERTGIHTERQVAWAWSQLANARSLPAFLRWFTRTFNRDDPAAGLDGAFQFLQACEFSFPRSVSAIEALVSYNDPTANHFYGAFIAGLEQWFRPVWMKQIDEAGVPIPLAERLAPFLRSPDNRSVALAQLAELDLEAISELDDVDRLILQFALETS